MALNAPDAAQVKRVGFMTGQMQVPEDFDRMGSQEIEALFAQAMTEGLTLITADALVAEYPGSIKKV